MSKYEQVIDDEWVQPVRKNYKFCCCDCGLVHKLNFRIYKNHIQFQAKRDNRATAQVRRKLKNEKAN